MRSLLNSPSWRTIFCCFRAITVAHPKGTKKNAVLQRNRVKIKLFSFNEVFGKYFYDRMFCFSLNLQLCRLTENKIPGNYRLPGIFRRRVLPVYLM